MLIMLINLRLPLQSHPHVRLLKSSDATHNTVIDKIQSLCTKINTKVNVNSNAYIAF